MSQHTFSSSKASFCAEDNPNQITNNEFIASVFRELPQTGLPVTCIKTGDPSEGGWSARNAFDISEFDTNANNYVNCSSFYLDADGSTKARKSNFAACHFIMLDDLGTKVPMERLRDFKVSWLLETSPGNFQAGIIMDRPIEASEDADRLLDAIIKAGLCDSGAVAASTRWARLPVGINGKAKHLAIDNQPFRCRLVKWAPETRYSVSEIVAGLDLELPDERTEPGTDNNHQSVTNFPSESVPMPTLKALLDKLDPDCGYNEWVKAMMVVFHETQGSEDGLALVDRWSSKGSKYSGKHSVETKWRSFRAQVSNPLTVGTLIEMVKATGVDITTIVRFGFTLCETEVINPSVMGAAEVDPSTHPLGKFSVRDRVADLERQMIEATPVLGNIALLGQITVIYAPPNTGKTLVVMALIADAIQENRFDPSKLYYVNMDDNSSGLVAKAKVANEYGFHMLADGHQNFKAIEFRKAMEQMIKEDTARGVIVVLDTLKKFVNTMDKTKSSDFAGIARQFSMKGGTVIALGHTNKHPGADGKAVYAGTTDIIDDFDCAYTIDTVPSSDTKTKVIEFTNRKQRGNVSQSVAYSYALEQAIDYHDLLLSVHEVEPDVLQPIKQSTAEQSDGIVIRAIEECISDGINSKMKLAIAAANRSLKPKRAVLKVIEKYTGEDVHKHRWTYTVEHRGMMAFKLLERPTPAPRT